VFENKMEADSDPETELDSFRRRKSRSISMGFQAHSAGTGKNIFAVAGSGLNIAQQRDRLRG
jgi:hypothetical protein